MPFDRVKRKLPFRSNFYTRARKWPAVLFCTLALLTFIFSFVGAFPAALVERWYARGIFPSISFAAGRAADAVPFSWLDVVVGGGLIFAAVTIYQRRFLSLAAVVSAAYLIFFWSWGLNYHRLPVGTKLSVEMSGDAGILIEQLTSRGAEEINRLYREVKNSPYDEQQVHHEVTLRVGRVVEVIDGSEWRAASRPKTSRLINLWFQVAGVDGLFNPFGHEPVINNRLLEVERPFVIAHELAHVRGYPGEGDANFVAVLATIVSEDPRLQYSGWLHLWFHLRNPKTETMLDDGPRSDLERIIRRMRSGRIGWLSDLQGAALDWFLKANSVPEGILSYSQVVTLAARTQEQWEEFR